MRVLTEVAGMVVVLAIAAAAGANTVASSTMYFQETSGYTLTDNQDGTYTGVLPMVDEAALNIGDGVSGYDVYAKNGATAWFGDDSGGGANWTAVAISNHDAWPAWITDTPDWYQYSLEFYVDSGVQKWRVRNHPGQNDAGDPWYDNADGDTQGPKGVPMSGTMDWTAKLATETDTGAYLAGTGTPEIPGGAASKGGGAGYWDMDWSWGSEAVPLQYGRFAVDVQDVGGDLRVTMTPVPEPLTLLGVCGGMAGIGAYIRRRRTA